jgi:hypothetical protein
MTQRRRVNITMRAWLAVTTYYWGFFAAIAFSRLLGRTTWFLDRPTVTNFQTLAPSPGLGPGAGAYRMSCTPNSTSFEDDLSRVSSARLSVLDRPADYCRLLWHGSILMQIVASDLHEDLLERNSLDKRWTRARRRFLTRQRVVSAEGVWPLRAA